MATFIPYPWQQAPWQRLQRQMTRHLFPHALLLSGSPGIGKWHFAKALADALLCLSPVNGVACGQCRSCLLLQAGTHPDKKQLLAEDNAAIKIDQVRQLSDFVAKTAQQGRGKVVLLCPVERLNVYSANALLKNLEEPAGDTVFILVSHRLGSVMATIRSRCQLLPLPTPSRAQASQWLTGLGIADAQVLLDMAGGAPLSVKAMVNSSGVDDLSQFLSVLGQLAQNRTPSIEGAALCSTLPIDDVLQWWLQLIHRMLVAQQEMSDDSANGAYQGIMSHIACILVQAKTINQQWLFKFADKLIQARKQYLQGLNLNVQLLMEELLLDWQALLRLAK